MTSKSVSQTIRKGMKANINGVAYPVECQPKHDQNAIIVTELVKRPVMH